MNRTHTSVTLATLALLLSGFAWGPALAQHQVHHAQKAQAKLPLTFVCKHCKIKMTIKQQSDWKKKCWVCPCKTTALACRTETKK